MLEQIKSPADLKKLPIESLPQLAEEMRERLTEVVFKNGGHLGSNLGVVELTVALFYVFNLPTDAVIWDVSHQSYPHKILSGRLDKFDTLRQFGGISGFSAPEESPCDPFMVGHAGTSVSTAVGMACANQILKNERNVIAVLGDGALTAGMTFEALNHAGTVKPNVLVILNDNKMSISSTIGAMSNYLNKLRMTHLYDDVKKEVYKILERIPPSVGHPMSKAVDHLRSAAVATMGGFIFEELGFKYYGPVDGHNIPKLIATLTEIQKIKGPILLHVVTDKGKGSDVALADPCRLHGVSPGKYSEDDEIMMRPEKETYTDVFARTATQLGEEHKNIVAITAAMPEGSGLIAFEKAHPTRYFDVGICEQHALGLAAGLAKSGLKPIVGIYSTFLQRAFDQLFQEIALQASSSTNATNLPSGIIFALDRAGLVGTDGPTHHGVFDIAYTRIFPKFILMAPRDGNELTQMLEYAVTLNQPVFIRYPRTTTPQPLVTNYEPIKLGMAEILKKGKDGVLLAYGEMVYPAYQAGQQLAKEGIDVMVVNARFAKPLDEKLINRLIEEQPFIITIEEHILNGGFGSAILESLSRAGKNTDKIIRLGIPDKFVEHGNRNQLLANLGLDTAGIIRTIKSTSIKSYRHI